MDLVIDHVDVWAASLKDQPGGLAEKLEALTEAGSDLQFVIARRAPERPGGGVVFVTPLRGDREIAAAADVGFNVTRSVHSVRVEGPDRPGVAARLTRQLAAGGLSLMGFSAAVIGTRFVVYLALDSLADANRAAELLEQL